MTRRAGAKPRQTFHMCVDDETCALGDVNGDRKADAVAFVRSTRARPDRGDVWAALSGGSGFSGAARWHDHMCVDDETCALADVDRDGRSDAVAFVKSSRPAPDKGDVWTARSSGGSFVAPVKSAEFACVDSEVCVLADLDGDRAADAVAFVRSTRGEPDTGDLWAANLTGDAPVMARPDSWKPTHTVKFGNEAWTEQAQGIATDGTHWYIGSNDADRRRLYKFGPDLPGGDGRVIASLDLPAGAGSHLGPPTYDPASGRIVIAVEPANVWIVDAATMSTVALAPLGANGLRPQGTSIPWAALSPVDGMLYSSAYGRDDQPIKHVDRLHVYNPNTFEWVRSIALDTTVREVQGGQISANGHLYLSAIGGGHRIHGFALPGGQYHGSTPVGSGGTWAGAELEGLTLGHYGWRDGDATQVAALLLDNDWPDKDDVVITFYATDPSRL